MKRIQRALGLWICAMAAMGSVAIAAPGETGDAMIAKLGPPANDFASPPQPSAADIEAGRDKLPTVYWLNAEYDPLKLGAPMRGNLVVTFQYPSGPMSERPGSQPRFGWHDLTSYSEVFLGQIDPEEWETLFTRLGESWTMQAQEERRKHGNAFRISTMRSKDGLWQLQISYSPASELASQPSAGSAPVFNFWSRIAPVQDPDWQPRTEPR
jgi:hypothetical protein